MTGEQTAAYWSTHCGAFVETADVVGRCELPIGHDGPHELPIIGPQEVLDSGVAGTTAASGRSHGGAEAGVAPGEHQDASPAAKPQVGDARTAAQGHAATIRRYLSDEFDDYSEAFAALDELLAELDRLRSPAAQRLCCARGTLKFDHLASLMLVECPVHGRDAHADRFLDSCQDWLNEVLLEAKGLFEDVIWLGDGRWLVNSRDFEGDIFVVELHRAEVRRV